MLNTTLEGAPSYIFLHSTGLVVYSRERSAEKDGQILRNGMTGIHFGIAFHLKLAMVSENIAAMGERRRWRAYMDLGEREGGIPQKKF